MYSIDAVGIGISAWGETPGAPGKALYLDHRCQPPVIRSLLPEECWSLMGLPGALLADWKRRAESEEFGEAVSKNRPNAELRTHIPAGGQLDRKANGSGGGEEVDGEGSGVSACH